MVEQRAPKPPAMSDIRCRYCDRYLCSAVARDGKLRITCQRCKRSQVVELSQPVVM